MALFAETRRKTNAARPDLPDDILHQIHRLLPTKPAVRMRCVSKQFGGVWSINLDESDPIDSDDDIPRHTKFITNSINYLDSRNKDKHVDIFRLRMTTHSPEDDAIISRFLNFAIERNVMELDVSLRYKPGTEYYTFRPSFGKENFITTLHLENVRISEGGNILTNPLPFLRTVSLKSVILDSRKSLSRLLEAFPNIHTLNLESMNIVDAYIPWAAWLTMNRALKTMSLKTVRMCYQSITMLICRFPAIEYLSLASCSFSGSIIVHVQFCSPSLMNFEFTDDGALNLSNQKKKKEKYRFDLKCENLKHLYIRAQDVDAIELNKCKEALQAKIDTPELPYFSFTGPLESKIYMQCRIPDTAALKLSCGNITSPWRHFPTLIDFLKTFEGSKRIILCVTDVEEFIFPESSREIFSASRLRSLGTLEVYRDKKLAERDSDLRDSMLWIAPNANLQIFNFVER